MPKGVFPVPRDGTLSCFIVAPGGNIFAPALLQLQASKKLGILIEGQGILIEAHPKVIFYKRALLAILAYTSKILK
jgi:hypothetical protein